MKLLLIILFSICSAPVICQPETKEDVNQKYIECLDAYIMESPNFFELPEEGKEFIVKKIIITLYLRKGKLVSFDQQGVGFKSNIGEIPPVKLFNASCIEMFEKVKKKKTRRGQKVIRVYEYFLEAPGKHFSRQDKKKFVKEFFNQEVENELEKLKKGGKILDISYKFISAGYPIF